MEGNNDSVDVTGDDRISKLPKPILHHILSFISSNDAARMSTVSKVCASAWNSLPYLNFGYIHYGSQHMHDVIDQILENRKKNNIPMQNFSLWLGYYHPRLCFVDNWIKILVACNIKELNLREKPDNVCYSLPETIFSAKSLTVLSLEGFKIELPADEHLSLRYFNGLTSFQVGETLPKLKKVNLVNLGYDHSVLQLIDIAAINVEDLSINNHSYGNINAVRVTDCKTLKSFYLNCVDITDNWLEELFYSLQNLEKFDLT
ncbi:hypothetical protein BC332_16376 [Capsicum chinense]|nr:hypothetical protein BC332_16376 [Capsicum chinense]